MIHFFDTLELSHRQQLIAKQILKEIRARLDFLRTVGLEYLTLSRTAGTLSGGEAQRIRLATQIGSAWSASCIFSMNRLSAFISGTMINCSVP